MFTYEIPHFEQVFDFPPLPGANTHQSKTSTSFQSNKLNIKKDSISTAANVSKTLFSGTFYPPSEFEDLADYGFMEANRVRVHDLQSMVKQKQRQQMLNQKQALPSNTQPQRNEQDSDKPSQRDKKKASRQVKIDESMNEEQSVEEVRKEKKKKEKRLFNKIDDEILEYKAIEKTNEMMVGFRQNGKPYSSLTFLMQPKRRNNPFNIDPSKRIQSIDLRKINSNGAMTARGESRVSPFQKAEPSNNSAFLIPPQKNIHKRSKSSDTNQENPSIDKEKETRVEHANRKKYMYVYIPHRRGGVHSAKVPLSQEEHESLTGESLIVKAIEIYKRQTGKTPKYDDPKAYNLRIAEDDGSPSMDLPVLDKLVNISKYNCKRVILLLDRTYKGSEETSQAASEIKPEIQTSIAKRIIKDTGESGKNSPPPPILETKPLKKKVSYQELKFQVKRVSAHKRRGSGSPVLSQHSPRQSFSKSIQHKTISKIVTNSGDANKSSLHAMLARSDDYFVYDDDQVLTDVYLHVSLPSSSRPHLCTFSPDILVRDVIKALAKKYSFDISQHTIKIVLNSGKQKSIPKILRDKTLLSANVIEKVAILPLNASVSSPAPIVDKKTFEYVMPLSSEALSYTEFQVAKTNKFGVKQERRLGIDPIRLCIYNKKPKGTGLLGFATSSNTKHPVRSIDALISVKEDADGNKKAFDLVFDDETLHYEAKTQTEAKEIVKKLKYLVKMSRQVNSTDLKTRSFSVIV